MGVVPRALKYFVVLSVFMHGSLVFIGRQFSGSTAQDTKGKSPEILPANTLAHAEGPFRLDLAGLKTKPLYLVKARNLVKARKNARRGHQRAITKNMHRLKVASK